MKINRRKQPRVHEDLSVNIEFGNVFKYQARIVDISIGGLKLARIPGYAPGLGEQCRVVIRDQAASVSFSVAGEVLWQADEVLGIRFTGISSEAKRMLNRMISDLSQLSMQTHNAFAVG
ncbi:MAG: PilZ domain-containing protein [Thiotrichales bacterium]|nr:PilZ domain-containing protein [Thiotrichales bacterium]